METLTNLEKQINNRIEKSEQISIQIRKLKNLKNKIYIKHPYNNNVGYDFCEPKNIAYMIGIPPETLINKDGENIEKAMQKVNDKLNEVIDSFIEALHLEFKNLYKD